MRPYIFILYIFVLGTAILGTVLPRSSRAQSVLKPEQFAEMVVENNLDLSLLEAQTENLRAKAFGIRLPSPTVGFGRMDMNMTNMEGMARDERAYSWQISQKIPFPTKIKQEYSVRKHELHARQFEEQALKQTLIAQSNWLYFMVWVAQEEKDILNEKIDMISKHIRVAKTLARSDTLAKIHLLRVESQREEIENELETLAFVLKERLFMAAEFVNKDPKTFKFTALDPGLSPIPEISSIKEIPQVKAMDLHVQHFKSTEKLGKFEWLPDFTLTYSEMQETARFPENRQIMLGITLPFLYFWQTHSKSKEGAVKRLEAEIKLKSKIREIQTQKAKFEANLVSLKKRIYNFQKKILPKSIQRTKLFKNVSPRDLSSLQEHLSSLLSVPEVKMKVLQLKAEYEKNLAELAQYQTSEDM